MLLHQNNFKKSIQNGQNVFLSLQFSNSSLYNDDNICTHLLFNVAIFFIGCAECIFPVHIKITLGKFYLFFFHNESILGVVIWVVCFEIYIVLKQS